MLSPELCTNTTTTATAIAGATTAASTTTTKASSPTPPAVKTKKRRRQKRRKRARHATACTGTSDNGNNQNNNGTGTQLEQPLLGCVSATATSVSGGRKCKAQYFQHDNRKYIAKYESFHFTAETATTAAALNYAAVAKKFKPLRPTMLASGAKKNRRTALIRKSHGDCACVCQNLHVPQCPQEAVAHGGAQKTADHHCRERKEERGRPHNEAPMKININGQALPALIELLKQTPSTWLKTLLLGAAGSAVVGR